MPLSKQRLHNFLPKKEGDLVLLARLGPQHSLEASPEAVSSLKVWDGATLAKFPRVKEKSWHNSGNIHAAESCQVPLES